MASRIQQKLAFTKEPVEIAESVSFCFRLMVSLKTVARAVRCLAGAWRGEAVQYVRPSHLRDSGLLPVTTWQMSDVADLKPCSRT